RKWSDEEKREICQQAVLPGASVAQIARRYSANANMIHNWLKDPRFAPDAEDLAMPTDASFSSNWMCRRQPPIQFRILLPRPPPHFPQTRLILHCPMGGAC
ncbi:transposase, partial [Leisingera sp. S232]